MENFLDKYHKVDIELLYEMLKEVTSTLSELEFKWCAFGGTLLGAYRDGDFVGSWGMDGKFHVHDFDIDLIVFGKDTKSMNSIFNSFKEKKYGFNNFERFNPAVIFKNNEWCDLWSFEYSKDNPDYIGMEGFLFHRNFFDKLKTAKIRDTEIFIPNNTIQFLDLYYGTDWRIPYSKGWGQFTDNRRLKMELDRRMKLGI